MAFSCTQQAESCKIEFVPDKMLPDICNTIQSYMLRFLHGLPRTHCNCTVWNEQQIANGVCGQNVKFGTIILSDKKLSSQPDYVCHESDQFHTTKALIPVLLENGFKQSRMTAACSYGYMLVFCGLYIHYELLYYYIIAIYI